MIGKDVAFTQNGQDFRGVATTINGNGELIVQLPDGTTKTLSLGKLVWTRLVNGVEDKWGSLEEWDISRFD